MKWFLAARGMSICAEIIRRSLSEERPVSRVIVTVGSYLVTKRATVHPSYIADQELWNKTDIAIVEARITSNNLPREPLSCLVSVFREKRL